MRKSEIKTELAAKTEEAKALGPNFIVSLYQVSARKFQLGIQNNAKNVEIGDEYDYCGESFTRLA